MKYSEGPTTQAQVDIAAAPAAVWTHVTDLQVPAATSAEFRGAEWLDGATGPAVGARFKGRNEHEAIGAWETVAVVTVADEPREFAYVIGEPDNPGAVWRYLIEPTADGCRLTQIAQIGPGPSGLSPALERMPEKEERIVARRLSEHQAGISANIAHIKELAERAS